MVAQVIPFVDLISRTHNEANLSYIMRNEDIYLIDLNVEIGRRTISIKLNHLAIAEEAITTLKALEGKVHCQMFKGLNKIANKLNYETTRLKNKFLVKGSEINKATVLWYLSESSIEQFWQDYLKLKELAAELLEQISSEYFSAKQAYKTSVQTLLATTPLSIDEQEKALNQYVAQFPSLSSIQNNFGVFISRLEEIPSLKKQSLRDAELAESEAKVELMKEYKTFMQRAIEQAAKSATEEIYELLAEQISILVQYADRDLPKSKIKFLEESTERISILVSHTQRLGWDEILEQLNAVQNAVQGSNYIELQSQVEKLKTTLKEDESFLELVKEEDSAFSWAVL